ncbi:MAG: hypothetical protein HZB61_07430 [Nitrospirae bacterium]|nr:hypothetical protein [Nitrospirota bacterium]
MDSNLHRTFNDEVNRYKNALLFYARKCDWDTFKVNAGRLFDYVESIEMSEIERRFYNISKVIVMALFIVVIFILKMDQNLSPGITRLKDFVVIIAVAGGSFEIYFLLNFKMYMKNKIRRYKKRRERFIMAIEQDFKEIVVQLET